MQLNILVCVIAYPVLNYAVFFDTRGCTLFF